MVVPTWGSPPAQTAARAELPRGTGVSERLGSVVTDGSEKSGDGHGSQRVIRNEGII